MIPLDKPELDSKAVFRALSDDASFGTVLHIICLVKYGPDIYDWDILDLLQRLEEDYHVRVSDANEQKLNAIMMATSTELFYRHPDAFRGVCNTLTAGDPSLDFLDDLTLAEVLWGLWEVEANHGPGAFSQQVQAVIDKEVNEEANDPESDGPGLGYIQRILQERHESLIRQMEALDLRTEDLPPPPDLIVSDPVSDPDPAAMVVG